VREWWNVASFAPLWIIMCPKLNFMKERLHI
jgi:hypothetical protein